MSDTKRLEWLMTATGADGFLRVEKDRYEYARDVANEEGREEPNANDELEGFRRCVDEGMRLNP